jgi:hypothetical protein
MLKLVFGILMSQDTHNFNVIIINAVINGMTSVNQHAKDTKENGGINIERFPR